MGSSGPEPDDIANQISRLKDKYGFNAGDYARSRKEAAELSGDDECVQHWEDVTRSLQDSVS